MSIPNGCTRPTGELLDVNGDCVLSGLLPGQCGLPCHRNCDDLPITEAVFDTREVA